MAHHVHIHLGDAWEENKHKRDPDGKFSSGSGSSSELGGFLHKRQALKAYGPTLPKPASRKQQMIGEAMDRIRNFLKYPVSSLLSDE